MVLGGSRDPLQIVTPVTGVVDISTYKFFAYEMVANKDSSTIIEFFGVLQGGVEKWQYAWNTELDIINVTQFITPRLSEFNGKLYTTEAVGDWLAVACSDCSSPFVNFYDRDGISLAQAFKMTDTYGQAKFSLAWFKNNFNSINVFVASSAQIDMIEIYTPPKSETKEIVDEKADKAV